MYYKMCFFVLPGFANVGHKQKRKVYLLPQGGKLIPIFACGPLRTSRNWSHDNNTLLLLTEHVCLVSMTKVA